MLGYIALVPVFLAVRRASVHSVIPLGFLYGAVSYALYAFWLYRFSHGYFLAVICSYGAFLSIVFMLMYWAKRLFPVWNSYVMALIWCVYEYVKSLGFLGFSYGILGYTQWQVQPALLSSMAGGVWVPSALCAFTAAAVTSLAGCFGAAPRITVFRCMRPVAVVLSCHLLALLFCIWTECRPTVSTKSVKVACIQNNPGLDKYEVSSYERDVGTLLSLTEEALERNPDVQIVVWPETAVVPGIVYHYESRVDFERFNLIVSMLDRLSRQDVCVVLGNQFRLAGEGRTDDYNAVLVFDSRERALLPPAPEVYEKMHLVPFIEYIPFAQHIPGIDRSRLWSRGRRPVVFTKRGISFSTPICFEDTFGSICRRFVSGGAQMLVNLSNDSWASSKVCQTQHLAMAVFRSAENHVPVVRSTASGRTCITDCRGRIVQEADPCTASYIVGSVEVDARRQTLYTICGDWIPLCESAVLIWLFLCGIRCSRVRGVERIQENEVI